MKAASAKPVLALSGGVGGAKLALGLSRILALEDLHVLVNTGDDFEHFGLHISPDIDTLLYTLSGRANPEQGWGLAHETFHVLESLRRIGAQTWFRLGDRDLATHLWRTQQLAAGRSLSAVTADLAARLGAPAQVHPMCDEPVRTMVRVAGGSMAFQQYFVRERCVPPVTGFSFEGIDAATPVAAVRELLEQGVFAHIVICPSNPFVSIDPMLGIPGLWTALRDSAAPVTVVSPIVAGAALKGPAAKMMGELGLPVTAVGVARHYAARYPGLVDHFVVDQSDGTLAPEIESLGMVMVEAATVMQTLEEKIGLARRILALTEA